MLFLVPWLPWFGAMIALSVVVVVVHDLIVGDWEITGLRAEGAPARAPSSGALITQVVTVSFRARSRKWLPMMMGPRPQAAWWMRLTLGPGVACDARTAQYCPFATGGVRGTGDYSKQMQVVWDRGPGVHDLQVDVGFDGKQLTNLSGDPGTALKVQMTIT